MHTPIARVVVAFALFWAGARQIWWELRTPGNPIFDFSVLCMVIGGTAMAASLALLAYSSVRLYGTVRDRERSDAPAQPQLAGPVMRANALLAVAWIAVGVIAWNYLTPPYARLVPEPSVAIPIGETAVFTVETDIPSVGVYAERAYRPEGQCGTDDERVGVEDGDRVTIEACDAGIGVIHITGVGDSNKYELGTPTDGREVAYHVRFQFLDRNFALPITVFYNRVYHEWGFDLDGIRVGLDAVGWHSEQVMVPISTSHRPLSFLDSYFVDIFDDTGVRLVRLDFEDASRIGSSGASSAVLDSLDVHPSDNTFIYQWGPCAKPDGWSGFVSVSVVEKSPMYDSSDAPAC